MFGTPRVGGRPGGVVTARKRAQSSRRSCSPLCPQVRYVANIRKRYYKRDN